MPQRFDCLPDLANALPFSQDHLAARAPDAEIKAFAAYRTQLEPHQPGDNYRRLRAPCFTLLRSPIEVLVLETHITNTGLRLVRYLKRRILTARWFLGLTTCHSRLKEVMRDKNPGMGRAPDWSADLIVPAAKLLVLRSGFVDANSAIREMTLWKALAPTPERPHGFKYRLHYGSANGRIVIRYRNETGEGNHC